MTPVTHRPPFPAQPKELAALALTDAITKLGPDTVTDEIWDAAAAHFEPIATDQLLEEAVADRELLSLALTRAFAQQPA